MRGCYTKVLTKVNYTIYIATIPLLGSSTNFRDFTEYINLYLYLKIANDQIVSLSLLYLNEFRIQNPFIYSYL